MTSGWQSLFLILVISIPAMTQTKSAQPRIVGPYGGQGVEVIVEKNSVQIEYDCATGRIAGPLRLDQSGRFVAKGVHKRELPGAIRLQLTPKEQPARFEGSIVRGLMRFKVIIVATDEIVGDFTARRGRTAVLRKCR
jgi:hypothetical protein